MRQKSANWVVMPGSVILAYGVIKLNPGFAHFSGPDIRLILCGALLLGLVLGYLIDSRRGV